MCKALHPRHIPKQGMHKIINSQNSILKCIYLNHNHDILVGYNGYYHVPTRHPYRVESLRTGPARDLNGDPSRIFITFSNIIFLTGSWLLINLNWVRYRMGQVHKVLDTVLLLSCSIDITQYVREVSCLSPLLCYSHFNCFSLYCWGIEHEQDYARRK